MLIQDYDSICNKLTDIAWSRDILAKNKKWLHVLKEDERSSIKAYVNNSVLNRLLLHISNEIENHFGFFVIKNFPLGTSIANTMQLYLRFCQNFGYILPQNHLKEKIISIKNISNDINARGPYTNEALQFHSDRSDITALLCLEQSELGGETLIASSPFIHNKIYELSAESLQILYSSFYYARANWEKGNHNQTYYAIPIFSIYKGYFASRYMRPLIEEAQQLKGVPPITSNQLAALSLMEAIANEPSVHIKLKLQPGDILLFNNFTTFHARYAFQDINKITNSKTTIRRRHLLRLWLSAYNSRPLSKYFQPLYGNINPGKLRGGYNE